MSNKNKLVIHSLTEDQIHNIGQDLSALHLLLNYSIDLSRSMDKDYSRGLGLNLFQVISNNLKRTEVLLKTSPLLARGFVKELKERSESDYYIDLSILKLISRMDNINKERLESLLKEYHEINNDLSYNVVLAKENKDGSLSKL